MSMKVTLMSSAYEGNCIECGEHFIRRKIDSFDDGALCSRHYKEWQKEQVSGGECKVVASSTEGLITNEPKKWFELSCGHSFKLDGASGQYRKTEAEAIAAWNSRADYHGYEQAAIEAWESIKAWNSRAERTCEFAPDGMMDDRLWFSCSNCGGYITTDYGMPSYCPHCGAKVVGE